uniref:Ig-like domain-containing protein n=1 Tax=Labrus bergylta TaxID=56723 RepID=A0A3Q3L2Y5_9LABR
TSLRLCPFKYTVYHCSTSTVMSWTVAAVLWGDEGQSATMTCEHTKGATYFQMYWYRQLPGETMQQIVLTRPSVPPQYWSDFSEDKFPAKKDNFSTGSLTVEKLLPADSGVYFCARWSYTLEKKSS